MLIRSETKGGLAEHFRAVHAIFYFQLYLLGDVVAWENPHYIWNKCLKSVAAQSSEGISPIDFSSSKIENVSTRASVRQLERDTPSARGEFI